MKRVVDKLIGMNKTISTMESCTGGFLASSITDIEGSSEILKFSAVTYSNEFKMKMGVSDRIIDKYSVYSMETAIEMSKNISLFTNSNYGVGITGKLNRIDINNLYGEDNIVFVSIYDSDNEIHHNFKIKVDKQTRKENKEFVVEYIKQKLLDILEIKYEKRDFVFTKNNK